VLANWVDVLTALLVLKCRAENRRLLPKSEILFARQAFEVFGAMRSELCLHVELKGSLARRSSKPIKRGLAHYLFNLLRQLQEKNENRAPHVPLEN